MATPNFTGYFKTPSDATVYGVAEGGQRVGFSDPTQLAQAQGLDAADFSQVQTDPTFNPAEFISYSDYLTGLGSTAQPNSQTPTEAALAQAQASGEAPQEAGQAAGALQQFMPQEPVFYKPTTPVSGYDPQTVFDATGKPLSYDQYMAAGGKPDFSNVQAGSPPTQQDTQTEQTGLTPSFSPVVEQQLAEDPGYQQLLQSVQEYNSVANQQTSLMDFYKQALQESGLQGINEDLISMKNVIDGTEDDIRAEIQSAGGFVTESQVMALAGARNKQLIKNYNNLLDTKAMLTDQINTMVGLAAQDRQFALDSATQKLNIQMQLLEYRDKFIQNAQEGYNRVIEAVGYQGLYNMLQDDPQALALAEQTLGMGTGSLQGITTNIEQQENIAIAQAAGVTSKFYNIGGELRNALTGEAYATPEEFFAAAGVNSFDEAQKQGLITNIGSQIEQELVAGLIQNYPDAGIQVDDSLPVAQSKLVNSRIYQDQVRSPITGGGGGGSSVTGLSGTSTQFQAAGYATRMQQANDVINNLEGSISGYSPFGFTIQSNLPNSLKSDIIRQSEQAERNFVNAILRRESGAAISPDEFKNATLQYFPRPGDDQGTLLQKRMNRETAIQNLVNEAGTAYGGGQTTIQPTQTSGVDLSAMSPQDVYQLIQAAKSSGDSKETVIQDLINYGYPEFQAKDIVTLNWGR